MGVPTRSIDGKFLLKASFGLRQPGPHLPILLLGLAIYLFEMAIDMIMSMVDMMERHMAFWRWQ